MHPIRSTIGILTALALALAALSPVVMAQEEAAEHPIVGAWFLDATPDDPSDPVEVVLFSEGGTVSNPGNGAAGAWEPGAARSADLTVAIPALDPQSGVVAGFVTLRASVEVAEDGQSLSGTFTLEPPAAMARMMGAPEGQLGPGKVTAQRIGVEPMGATVGPIPDLSQLQVGGAAASPMAPEASPAG